MMPIGQSANKEYLITYVMQIIDNRKILKYLNEFVMIEIKSRLYGLPLCIVSLK